jgi:hypothetical protein
VCALADRSQKVEAASVREHEIEDDEIGSFELALGVGEGRGERHPVAVPAQGVSDGLRDGGFILDHQNARHGLTKGRREVRGGVIITRARRNIA